MYIREIKEFKCEMTKMNGIMYNVYYNLFNIPSSLNMNTDYLETAIDKLENSMDCFQTKAIDFLGFYKEFEENRSDIPQGYTVDELKSDVQNVVNLTHLFVNVMNRINAVVAD